MEVSQEPVDSLLDTTADAPAFDAPVALATRIHYLDNLRALAMLLGVYLHGALAYAEPAQSIWLATDRGSSVAIDVSIWFIHLFRMGLFFVLSGYFAKLVIERKSLRYFLRSRCLRIALPFVLFYPLLVIAITVVIVFAISYLPNPRGLMGFITTAAQQSSLAAPPELPGTMHLWFLYYLLAFTLVGALLSRVKRLRLPAFLRTPLWLGVSPMLLVPGALVAGAPLPAPESFIPQWWPFAFYGLFYLAGWKLYGCERQLDTWRPYMWPVVAVSILLFIPYYLLMPELNLSMVTADVPLPPAAWWQGGVVAVLTAYLSVLLILAALLLGQRYLSGRSQWLSVVADASYWLYLVHLPLVIFLQTLLVPYSWPVWLKLTTVLGGTLAPCLATYLVFVRYTPLGWMLHGKRTFP